MKNRKIAPHSKFKIVTAFSTFFIEEFVNKMGYKHF
jgi:hypothetical protein